MAEGLPYANIGEPLEVGGSTFNFSPESEGRHIVILFGVTPETLAITDDGRSVSVTISNEDGSFTETYNPNIPEGGYVFVNFFVQESDVDADFTITTNTQDIVAVVVPVDEPVTREGNERPLTYKELDSNILIGYYALVAGVNGLVQSVLNKYKVPDTSASAGQSSALGNYCNVRETLFGTKLLMVNGNGDLCLGYIQQGEGSYEMNIDYVFPGLEGAFQEYPDSVVGVTDAEDTCYANLMFMQKVVDVYGNETWSYSTSSDDTGVLNALLDMGLTPDKFGQFFVAFNTSGYGLRKGFCAAYMDVSTIDPYSVTIAEASEVSPQSGTVLATLSKTVGSYNKKVTRWCTLGTDSYGNITLNEIVQAS